MTSQANPPSTPPYRIPLSKPSFDTREEQLVCETLRSGWVTQGPRVAEFERLFAAAVQAEEAVGVSSGTTALFLTLHALGIGQGDEVIVPSLTYIASANAIVHCGATPVFVDIDPHTLNIDPDVIEAALSSKTRAIMVVHQLGLPADLDRIQTIADHNNLYLVEDAACAVGTRYKDKPIGSSGNLICFSFHPRKVLVTGEGGMITTNDAALAAHLRRLRHQGMTVTDLERHSSSRVIAEEYPEIGYNVRLSDLQAAVGIGQLQKLEAFVSRLRSLGTRYDTALAQLEAVEVRSVPSYAQPTYQSYILRLRGATAQQRDHFLNMMLARGIATRRGLMAVHQELAYRDNTISQTSGSLRHTEDATAQTLLLPIYPTLSDAEQTYILDQLAEVVDEIFCGSGP